MVGSEYVVQSEQTGEQGEKKIMKMAPFVTQFCVVVASGCAFVEAFSTSTTHDCLLVSHRKRLYNKLSVSASN